MAGDAGNADVQHSDRLLQHFLVTAGNRHDFADRFHLRAEFQADFAEFFQIPARIFQHDVIQRRLKTSRRLLRHRIFNIIQAVAERELRSDERERIAGRFRGERGTAAQAGVDLDNPVIFGVRVQRVLNVAFADDAEMPNNLNRNRAQHEIFG